jgi:predicted metal-dependent phosphoesterase TrpH
MAQGKAQASAHLTHAGTWYAVQLHAHSTHSDGVFTVPQLIAMAKKEGLDALGLSDHDTTTQWLDPALVAEKELVMLRSEEARDDLENNHMGLHGMAGSLPVLKLPRDQGLQEASARQGTIIANHPANRFVPWKPLEMDSRVHAIEVWNGWFWNPLVAAAETAHGEAAQVGAQDPHGHAPASPEEAISTNERAISWWSDLLADGVRVAPVAAADFHRKPQNLASPCTLVYASEKSEAGILAGIRAGRTLLVRHPRGQRIELAADSAGDSSFAALPGDTVAPGTKFRVRALRASGDTLRVMAGRREILRTKVAGADWQRELTLPEATGRGPGFVYARLDSGTARQMHGMTGAIYVR